MGKLLLWIWILPLFRFLWFCKLGSQYDAICDVPYLKSSEQREKGFFYCKLNLEGFYFSDDWKLSRKCLSG